MSEELQQESTLPSDAEEVISDSDYFESLKNDDGKIEGRFDSARDMIEFYKRQEKTHTNNMRELKEGIKNSEAEAEAQVQKENYEQGKTKALNDLVGEFMQSNTISDDMNAKMSEYGIGSDTLELNAIKLKQAVDTAYSTVGGKDNYDAMMKWANDNLSDSDKASFDRDLSTGASVFAIEGLNARFKSASMETQGDKYRVQGNPASSTTRGYSSFSEIARDRKAMEKDPSLRSAYERKMDATDPKVYGM